MPRNRFPSSFEEEILKKFYIDVRRAKNYIMHYGGIFSKGNGLNLIDSDTFLKIDKRSIKLFNGYDILFREYFFGEKYIHCYFEDSEEISLSTTKYIILNFDMDMELTGHKGQYFLVRKALDDLFGDTPQKPVQAIKLNPKKGFIIK